jgi:phosphopantothenoylcysteine synthetase/decarboxylase
VVAVGGGIAAYKACELVRLLTKAGALVTVVMTRRAQKFVGALTFQALTGRRSSPSCSITGRSTRSATSRSPIAPT